MTIKREITEFRLVLADGSIHTLANCNPGNVECIKPTWAANDWKEMFQLPLDCTVEVAFDTNTRLYSILSKGLGWAVLHLRQDNKLYSWQIFLKSATDSAIQFILLSKETVTDLDKPLLDRATDAITVLERGLRHIQMEAPDATVSWIDDTGSMNWKTLSDYVDYLIKQAKEACRK